MSFFVLFLFHELYCQESGNNFSFIQKYVVLPLFKDFLNELILPVTDFSKQPNIKAKTWWHFHYFRGFSLDDSKNAHIHQKAKENDNSLS